MVKRGEDDWQPCSDGAASTCVVENADALDARRLQQAANSARAVSAAEAMAKPLPIAAVVLPTESNCVCLLAYLGRKFTYLRQYRRRYGGDRSEPIDGKLHSRGRHHGGGGDTHTVETGPGSAPDRSGERMTGMAVETYRCRDPR